MSQQDNCKTRFALQKGPNAKPQIQWEQQQQWIKTALEQTAAKKAGGFNYFFANSSP